MTLLYPSGYQAAYKLRTLAEHVDYGLHLRVDPEVIARAQALCTDCCEAGHGLGFGGGWRSSATQLAGFLSCHHRVASKAESDGCYYDGSWWAQNALTIHKAPPGFSYHEGLPSSNDLAAAIDLVGDQVYMQSVAGKYGLRVFGKIDYPHVQPSEWPGSRAAWNASMLPLPTWPLPGTPTPTPSGDDMIPHIQRMIDTRTDNTPLASGEVRRVAVMFGGSAAMVNLTIVPLDGAGFLSIFDDRLASPPDASNVNWSGADGPVANAAFTAINGGWAKVYASAPCHLIIDLQGYQP